MANKIGRFEILSEIVASDFSAVYKASDPQSGQTIALKTIQLQMLGDQASVLVDQLLHEADGTKPLNSHNIALLHGLEEIDGQFCAAMEYVQGNSIGTMLARKEGFSIWDLQDIARQTCQGLDHAHSHGVVHYSLEPAKIMVTWDGTVKILSFGASSMGAFTCQIAGKAPEVLHYVSPEQLRGDPVDARSNMFSLGAILYEMVTEIKAFPGQDADQVRQAVYEATPVAPKQINPKIHPALSEVIMKALSKAPEERYQSGQELVNDLERCKESPTKKDAKKPATPSHGLNVPQAAKAAVSTAAQASVVASAPTVQGAGDAPVLAKAAAAAAGWEGAGRSAIATPQPLNQVQAAPKAAAQNALQERASTVAEAEEAAVQTPEPQTALRQSPVRPPAARPTPAAQAPAHSVDPAMVEEAKKESARGPSFSEISELPPMKEIYTPPPPPPAAEPHAEPPPAAWSSKAQPQKPKVQPREVARKAVTEIKKTPPQLFVYSIAAALGVILLIVSIMWWRIHSENSADDGSPEQPGVTAPSDSGVKPAWNSSRPPAPTPAPVAAPERIAAGREPAVVSIVPKYNRKKVKPAAVSAPAAIPGQLTINSTPEGAEVHIDGRSDPSWVTPFNLPGLPPGQHSVTITRSGYSTESRTIDVASGSKSFLVVQLAQITAMVAAASEPPGAQLFIDGKDTGRVTPAQISLDKPGNHTFLVRKQGYLEETAAANLQAGQIYHFAPSLKALGSTDDIKVGGKFKKLFGGGDTAGMGSISIKTQPKGAQVAVNNRIMDKFSPLDLYLNPGTYVVDVTLSGFKRVHRVIEVQKGGKVAVDEVLERE
jgi:eukaryotic-like serine/threonine-protein kinase